MAVRSPLLINTYGTHQFTKQTALKTSRSVVSYHSMSSHRRKQNQTLTVLIRPTPLTFSDSIVPTAADGASATYMLTAQIEQIRSRKQYARISSYPPSTAKKRFAYTSFSLRRTEFFLLRFTTLKSDGPLIKQAYFLQFFFQLFSVATARSCFLASQLAQV